MGDDRPFACHAAGCGQRFTNEDHLAVHKHKHEMTLKFGPGRDGVIVADQTPTPTRFLKNCEEVGLFTELASPFEQEFKKADEDLSKKSSLELNLSAVEEGKGKEGERMSQVVQRADGTTTNALPTHMERKDEPHKRGGNTTPTIVRPGSLLLTCETVTPLPPALPSPTSVITPTPPSNRTLPSPCGPVSLLLHLSDGQALPLGVTSPTVISMARLGTLVPNIPGIPGPTTNICIRHSPPPPSHSDAKLVREGRERAERGEIEGVDRGEGGDNVWRLKSALALHPILNGNMIDSVGSDQNSPLSITLSPPHSQLSPCYPHGGGGGGRRRRGGDEDPDERRRRFLERNRAAASRCRQKRKVWVSSLEKKAEELSHTNVQLQNEVRLLRGEVAQLKQLLLAHKDCPVTAIQKRTQEYIDDSPKELVEPSSSPGGVIHRSPPSARPLLDPLPPSPLGQRGGSRSLSHPPVIIAPPSHNTDR